MLPKILAGTASGLVVAAAGVRYAFPWLKYDWEFIKKIAALGNVEKKLENTTVADLFETRATEMPNKPFIIFEVPCLINVHLLLKAFLPQPTKTW